MENSWPFLKCLVEARIDIENRLKVNWDEEEVTLAYFQEP